MERRGLWFDCDPHRYLSTNYSYLWTTVRLGAPTSPLPDAIKNPCITFDSTAGPSHLQIQTTSDDKHYFQSPVGNPRVGMQKYWFWSSVGWIHVCKTHRYKVPTPLIEKNLCISGRRQDNIQCCSRVNCKSWEAKTKRILIHSPKSFRVVHCDPLCQVLRNKGSAPRTKGYTGFLLWSLPWLLTEVLGRGQGIDLRVWASSTQHSCSEWVSPAESLLPEQ